MCRSIVIVVVGLSFVYNISCYQYKIKSSYIRYFFNKLIL